MGISHSACIHFASQDDVASQDRVASQDHAASQDHSKRRLNCTVAHKAKLPQWGQGVDLGHSPINQHLGMLP